MPSTAIKTSPALVTTASESAGGVVGSAIPQYSAAPSADYYTLSLHDALPISAPSGGTAYTQVVTVTGPGTYTTSNANVATQVGTYTWHASYKIGRAHNTTPVTH